jgi:thiosulfate/3-mercaptopyruvate sulfurtransferase
MNFHIKTHSFVATAISLAMTIALAFTFVDTAHAAGKPAASIPVDKLVQPAELAAQLKDRSAAKTLILQVGFKTMFDQAHIPGSEYAGPGNTGAGLRVLRDRVAKLSKDSPILIYCGCCPWTRCPNMAAAYDTLIELGFTNVKAMIINDNFGTDWVDKGYPTIK